MHPVSQPFVMLMKALENGVGDHSGSPGCKALAKWETL